MKWLKAAYLLVGLVALGWLVAKLDFSEVLDEAVGIGWGLAALCGVYLLAFVLDTITWQLTMPSVPVAGKWTYRTWKVRMVGEMLNMVIPAGGFGGEPMKAMLMKRHYGIGYREGTASLVLAKTINVSALVAFLGVGFFLMIRHPDMPRSFHFLAALGLGGLGVGIFLFYVIQRYRVTSLAGTWLARFRVAARLESLLHVIADLDDRFVAFYTQHRARLFPALGLAFTNWMVGALETYATFWLLGVDITFFEAWIIEAAAQLVRAGLFVIPASIGVQEGAFVLATAAITGSPAQGAAVAVIRRARELIFLFWGAGLAALYGVKPGDGPPNIGGELDAGPESSQDRPSPTN